METLVILGALAFAINKTVSVIKGIFARDTNLVVTQVVVWVVGIAAIFLAANAGVTEDLVIPGLVDPLGAMDAASLVLLGWVLGGTGSFAFDIKKALDNGDDAHEPSLLANDGARE